MNALIGALVKLPADVFMKAPSKESFQLVSSDKAPFYARGPQMRGQKTEKFLINYFLPFSDSCDNCTTLDLRGAIQ